VAKYRPQTAPSEPATDGGNPLLEQLVGVSPVLHIVEKVRGREVAYGHEMPNEYQIHDSEKRPLGYIKENEAGSFWGVRYVRFGGVHRGFDVDVWSHADGGSRVFELKRGFHLWSYTLDVGLFGGRPLGRVQKKPNPILRSYELSDESGRSFALVRGPLWTPWTFNLLDRSGTRRGAISKRWSGMLREAFTDADAFKVEFGAHRWTLAQRAVILAAAVCIDYDWFEE
jgi:hypothetical protein